MHDPTAMFVQGLIRCTGLNVHRSFEFLAAACYYIDDQSSDSLSSRLQYALESLAIEGNVCNAHAVTVEYNLGSI